MSTYNRAKNITEWSALVKSRDKYTCQSCGIGEEVIAHHIKAILDEPDLVLDINNGQTLCRTCHIRIHNEQKPSVCCFPRMVNYENSIRHWLPIIPDELKEQYPQYIGVLQ